ncbi:zinc finger protein 26-like isoform X2 [Armigeres subalbatus]|uniref:zinc finger protein 26-like isoform X2 n=1 Tax=Armigeres subalbatus TaxID=124917 RepID=UPI002ED417E6
MEEALPEVPCHDPTQFCRLCFSQNSIHWVIRTFGTEVDLPFVNTIGECLGIWLSLEEDFPYAVCRLCTIRLEGIIEYREIVRRCDAALKAKRKADPAAMVLFYDYPEDKVFINGPEKPGIFPDDPAMIQPEVSLKESKSGESMGASGVALTRMSQAEKQSALRSYMDSYVKWTTDISTKKDDDEATVVAPESLEHDDLSELSVLCEKYVNPDRRTPPPLKKQIQLSRYTCCFCQLTFRTKQNLNGHKFAVHRSQKNTTECTECRQIFPSPAHLRQHMLRHRTDLYITCETCGMQFMTNNELQSHLKNNGCRLMTFGKCEYCDRTFSRRGRYIFHLKNLHPDKPIPEYKELPPKRNKSAKPTNSWEGEKKGRYVVMLEPLSEGATDANETVTDNPKLVCIVCYEKFLDLEAYDSHLPQCFIQDEDNETTSGSQRTPPPPYELCDCNACTEIFEAIDPFVEHLRNHETPLLIKPHDCCQCSGQEPKFLMYPNSPSSILGE